MIKRIWLLILVLALLLAACKSSSQSTLEKPATATSAPTATVKSPPTQTSTVEVTVEATAVSTSEVASGPGCTVVSYLPDDPSASLYPPVIDKEWVKGSSTARVTVIEYGDYQ